MRNLTLVKGSPYTFIIKSNGRFRLEIYNKNTDRRKIWLKISDYTTSLDEE